MNRMTLGAALLVAGLLCSPLMASKRHKRHAAVAPAAADSPNAGFPSNGTWGLGIGYLPGRTTTIPAVTGDYWLLDGSLALEGALGFGTFSGLPAGTNASGGEENSASNDFGIAAGARYVILRPSKYLLFEGIGRLDYTNEYAVTPAKGVEDGRQDGTVGLYLGAGFEAFLPFLPGVSLGLDTGLNGLLTGTSAVGAGASTTQSSLYLGGAGLGLPFTFSIHAYF